jgi:hypothetical protein
VYRGAEVPHWRPPLRAGQQQTLLLLFFVRHDFTGSLA